MSTQTGSLWRHPDFRRFWAGQTLSFFGSEVTLLALPLTAVVTLDASGVEMGLLAAAGTTPALAVGLFAGALVDRTRRRPILIAADLGRAAVLGSVPIVYLLDWLSVWYLCLVALLRRGADHLLRRRPRLPAPVDRAPGTACRGEQQTGDQPVWRP